MKHYSMHLKSRIMRRVYFMWFVRRVLPFLGVEIAVLAIIFFGAHSYISYSSIWDTAILRAANYSLTTFGWYAYDALAQTELMVKILFAMAIFVGWMAIRDTLRVSRQLARRNFFKVSRVT